ncbi:MAG: GAF domain-containing sensor histidine kinase [Bacteroidota bacterium]|nr:GAF domain-containing sensor histidine kinase [Bacteroidota bacterium]
MIFPNIPANERERLLDLANHEILDTPYEEEYDEIVHLASSICKVPMSTITLIDTHRQWFKASKEMKDRESPRETSFCGHAIVSNEEIFQIEDAWDDERFFDNPLVLGDPHIRFYAGVPLISKNGFKLGTLCVLDSKPNQLNEEQSYALKVLALQVSKMLELRIQNKLLESQRNKIEQQNLLLSRMISIIAHDVRSPIGALKSSIELQRTMELDEAEKKELETMLFSVLDSTAVMLDNIVDWGNTAIRDNKVNNEPIQLKAFVDVLLKDAQLSAALKKNTLINLIQEDTTIQSDKNILQFILRNLLANAIKFTKNGSISISTSRKENNCIITIEDTGIGITGDAIQKLLYGTEQFTTPGTNNEKGSGLGFTLIKEFLNRIHSSINIESAVGKGTAIHILIRQ